MSYYERFLELNSEDPALQREIASALRSQGQIYQLLGDDTNAEASLQKSIAIFRDLTQKFPDNRENVDGLAICGLVWPDVD